MEMRDRELRGRKEAPMGQLKKKHTYVRTYWELRSDLVRAPGG